MRFHVPASGGQFFVHHHMLVGFISKIPCTPLGIKGEVANFPTYLPLLVWVGIEPEAPSCRNNPAPQSAGPPAPFFSRLFLCRWLYVVEKQIILRYQDFLQSNKLPSPSLLIEILLPFNLICMHHARMFLSISKILIRISTSFIIHKEEYSLT